MLGPYPANVNDAEILRNWLQDPNGLCKLLQENDHAVVDRGSQDSETKLSTFRPQIRQQIASKNWYIFPNRIIS